MSVIQRWRQQALSNTTRIVLADAGDRRAFEAAEVLNAKGLTDAFVIDSDPSAWVTEKIRSYAGGLKKPPDLSDPLAVATLMVAVGEADGCVAGATRPTADVVRAGLNILGVSAKVDALSSCFFFVLPQAGDANNGRDCLVYGDCGVLPDPDPSQLASVAIASADTFRQLADCEPKVAMLSFSTKGSAEHPKVEKVRQGTLLVQQRAPDLAVDGELQFDAAWDSSVGESKAPGSVVAGQANVFIFPDLDSGNIAYKITQRLAGAQAFGPLLQGLNGVLHDLSRGCSSEDIVNVATIAAVQANAG